MHGQTQSGQGRYRDWGMRGGGRSFLFIYLDGSGRVGDCVMNVLVGGDNG